MELSKIKNLMDPSRADPNQLALDYWTSVSHNAWGRYMITGEEADLDIAVQTANQFRQTKRDIEVIREVNNGIDGTPEGGGSTAC